MESEKISQCRFCGIHTDFDVKDFSDGRYRAECKTCGTRTPIFLGVFGALEAWQEMMAPRAHDPIMAFDKDGNIRMLEQERSYRDRVDRMVAAIASGVYANPAPGKIAESRIVDWAMIQIDFIDKALAEPDARDV